MKTTLPRFYFIFLLSALFLFSFEDKEVNRRETRQQKVDNHTELKESDNRENKEEKTTKKTYKHYYRYSNLC